MKTFRKLHSSLVATRSVGVLSLACCLTTGGLAQAPGDSKAIDVSKVERKNLAPVSRDILKVQLPRPVEAALANGVTVLILEDHRFPTITVDLTIDGAGALWDAENERGLAG